MSDKLLYYFWGGLFIICAVLGFIPEPEGAGAVVCRALSLLFFLPPAVLLYRAKKRGSRDTAALIRNLSLLSLGLTLVTLIVNVVCAVGPESLGNALHAVLVVISTPMILSGHWALSLFLWACLLMVSLNAGKARG